MNRFALLVFLGAAIGCGGAVAPAESSAHESTATSTVRDPGPARRDLAPASALGPPQIRCALRDGRTIACSAGGVGLPDGVSGVEDSHTGEQCAPLAWVAPYAGHCATGSPCDVIISHGENGAPDYQEGVCE